MILQVVHAPEFELERLQACNIYNLVIYNRRNVSEDRLTVSNQVL
jgi:hypothetical protein